MRLSAPISGALVLALVLLATGAAVAAAARFSRTDRPLTGSTFQGANGSQAVTGATLGRTDWATLPAAGVAGLIEASHPDVVFGSASREGNPVTWNLVRTSHPPGDITGGWASVDADGAGTFLRLAVARGRAGNEYFSFELNRRSGRWINRRGDPVPCRMEGDLQITLRFPTVGPGLWGWVSEWDSSIGGKRSCAARGAWGERNRFRGANMQGGFNAFTISNSLPFTAGTVETIARRRFAETTLDLRKLMSAQFGRSCFAYTSFWMHSHESRSVSARHHQPDRLYDYVPPSGIDVRRCSAAGKKFFDRNANGLRDAGDDGLPGFEIYADIDDDGRKDRDEPAAITDEQGDYVIDGIAATGTYTLREVPHAGSPLGPWTCSHPAPCNHRVSATATPYARNKDFGNWIPARLTLRKTLDPAGDAGRFTLTAGAETVLAGAPANGSEQSAVVTLSPPGRPYVIRETAEPPALPAEFGTTIRCITQGVAPDPPPVAGVATTVAPTAGQQVDCAFQNSRLPVPAIGILKDGPPFAFRGATLTYDIAVDNPGQVAFAAGDVAISDTACDDDPALVERRDGAGEDDASPDTLDPGDEWIYTCERRTSRPDAAACEPVTLTNVAHVTAPGATARSDEVTTRLTCVRPRDPVVEVQVVGPATAGRGATLTYDHYVYNKGDVTFPASALVVGNPSCATPLELVARFDAERALDRSAGLLGPGDVWVYRCTVATSAPGPSCAPSTLAVTGTVEARRGGRLVAGDVDTVSTALSCPPEAPEPPDRPDPLVPPAPPAPPPDTSPSGEAPTVPSGAVLPEAGTAGTATLLPVRGCLRRGSRVTVRGARIAGVGVFLGGRRVGGVRVRRFQARATFRLTRDAPPGRYRATTVVRFRLGAGTPTVRLNRTVQGCARQLPRFTG